MISVDVFSGDVIPLHLLTVEAVRLYQRHLRSGGILAFHVSNSYLDLAPVVREEAEHAGLAAVMISSSDDSDTGGYAADWVLVTDNTKFLALPAITQASGQIEAKPGRRLWTDDYSGLLPILRLRPEKEEAD